MRIRSTKPEFWRSKTIGVLPWDVRLVLKGLESYVDDNGVGKDDIALIATEVFPRDLLASPRETVARLSEAISALATVGLIARYKINGEELIYIDRWSDLQRIDKPSKGRFPRPDGTLEYAEPVDRESYARTPEDLGSPPELCAPGTGEQGNRGTGEQISCSAAPSDLETAEGAEDEDPDPDPFDDFWAAYPRKIDKQKARRAWAKAIKTTSPIVIMEGLARYQFRDDPAFIPHPTTWLNNERWLVEEANNVRQLRPASDVPDGLNPALMPWNQ